MTHDNYQHHPLEQQESHGTLPGDYSGTLDLSGLEPQEIIEVYRLISGPLESDLYDFGPGVRFPESSSIEAWEALHEVSRTHPVASQHDAYFDLERTPWDGDPNELGGLLRWAIVRLPDTDIERAKEVFSAFANSPFTADRAMPLVERGYDPLVKLVKADHDYGVALWDQLIRDPDKRIRDAAESLLENQLAAGIIYPTGSRDLEKVIKGFYDDPRGMRCLDSDFMDDDELLDWSGLTRQDAYHLLESYAYAENHQYLRRLGSEALYKLIDGHVMPKGSKPNHKR